MNFGKPIMTLPDASYPELRDKIRKYCECRDFDKTNGIWCKSYFLRSWWLQSHKVPVTCNFTMDVLYNI